MYSEHKRVAAGESTRVHAPGRRGSRWSAANPAFPSPSSAAGRSPVPFGHSWHSRPYLHRMTSWSRHSPSHGSSPD